MEWFSIAFVCAISEERKKKIIIRKREHTNTEHTPQIISFCEMRVCAHAGRRTGESLFDCAIECKCVLYTYFWLCC